ncbi:hypothetical protein L6452_43116 [Arctium lappa]|uniref:Uncharacterized protein n=1 Tax=Arctium lappa TaxID=4217 RepID=A0ACB8XKX6_ARCLA|nr:hypothetical protein L6452_43116 [Arctium lappa]
MFGLSISVTRNWNLTEGQRLEITADEGESDAAALCGPSTGTGVGGAIYLSSLEAVQAMIKDDGTQQLLQADALYLAVSMKMEVYPNQLVVEGPVLGILLEVVANFKHTMSKFSLNINQKNLAAKKQRLLE